MKKFIKKHKTKILMIVCALFGGTVVASAETVATIFASSEVSYSNENMDATNVQDAIDELYEKIPNPAADTISKLGVTVATTGDGLYQDSTETDRYIYKGSNPSNYITFNGEKWRIYSIESDGSLKIIRSDFLSYKKSFDSSGSSGRRTSGYCSQGSAPNFGCNVWAATANLVEKPSSFVNGSVTGAVTADSTILTYLNSNTSGNYYYGLTETAKEQIVKYDWNVGPSGTEQDTYALSHLVSTTYEGKYKWKGKVGLLTKSEYMRASSNSSCVTAKYWYDNYSSTACKGSDYLYNSSNGWVLLSPLNDSSSNLFYAASGGNISYTLAYSNHNIRPALYLSSDITLSGSGTSTDPYTIVE